MSIITESAYKGNPNYFRITKEILWLDKGNFLNHPQDREKGSGKELDKLKKSSSSHPRTVD